MLELPEIATLSRQIDDALVGTTIESANCGNAQHKWAFYSRPKEDFGAMLAGSAIQGVSAGGKFVYVSLSSERVLTLGGMGGRILLHEPGSRLPKRHHFAARLADGRTLTVAIQGWGFIGLYDGGVPAGCEPDESALVSPLADDFTVERLTELILSTDGYPKRSVKSFLVQEPVIGGIGNGYLQDVLFRARIHPRCPVGNLSADDREGLHAAIRLVLREAVDLGGNRDERDLYDRPGAYVRILDKHTAGTPCPYCRTTIEKISYLGGSCYFCPSCQPAPTQEKP